MNDEIVEEIHQIRARLYEETKDLTDEERIATTRAASLEVRKRIAKIRASKKSANTADQQKIINQ